MFFNYTKPLSIRTQNLIFRQDWENENVSIETQNILEGIEKPKVWDHHTKWSTNL